MNKPQRALHNLATILYTFVKAYLCVVFIGILNFNHWRLV